MVGVWRKIRQVQHFETFPTQFLWRRKRVGFRVCKPTGEIKRCRRREGPEGTRIQDKVCAYHLRKKIYKTQSTHISLKIGDTRIEMGFRVLT